MAAQKIAPCCEPGCDGTVGPRSTSGRCRPCALARTRADPAIEAKRKAGLAAYFNKPGVRELVGERLRNAVANRSPADVERLREHGRWLIREVLTPEVLARAQTPQAREKSAATRSDKRMGWCPSELRPHYHALIVKKVPAAEARRIIEAEIPGTAEHAKRIVASHQLVQRLRHERDRAQAY